MRATHRIKTHQGYVLGYRNRWDERWYQWPEHSHIKKGSIIEVQPLKGRKRVKRMKGFECRIKEITK